MPTPMPKESEIERKWFVLDAEGQVLGRLASRVASILRGKHKTNFVPHLDVGDHVVVVNAERVHLTGRKLRSEEHTSELQSRLHLVCRLLLEKKKHKNKPGEVRPGQLLRQAPEPRDVQKAQAR